MTGLAFELLMVGLLLYGLAFLGLAAVRRPREAGRLEFPDVYDAPIFVRRGRRGTARRGSSTLRRSAS